MRVPVLTSFFLHSNNMHCSSSADMSQLRSNVLLSIDRGILRFFLLRFRLQVKSMIQLLLSPAFRRSVPIFEKRERETSLDTEILGYITRLTHLYWRKSTIFRVRFGNSWIKSIRINPKIWSQSCGDRFASTFWYSIKILKKLIQLLVIFTMFLASRSHKTTYKSLTSVLDSELAAKAHISQDVSMPPSMEIWYIQITLS